MGSYLEKADLSLPEPGDFSILFASRLANLRLLFPYIPESLNMVLMHFARNARIFYTRTDAFLADLGRAVADMTK